MFNQYLPVRICFQFVGQRDSSNFLFNRVSVSHVLENYLWTSIANASLDGLNKNPRQLLEISGVYVFQLLLSNIF